jgi:hypothetical protein
VLTYDHNDDPSIPRGSVVREFVPPEVFDKAFVDAIPGIPIILRADQHRGRVRPQTVPDLRVGTVLNARFDAATGELVGEYLIDVPEGLKALDDGWTAVSLRYDAFTDERPGEWTGPDGKTIRYDAIRTKHTTPNHLLLTRSGQRAAGAHLRADAGVIMDLAKLRPLLALLDINIAEDADEVALAMAIKDAAKARHEMRDSYDGAMAAVETMKSDAAARADAVAASVAALDTVRKGDGPDFLAGLTARARFDAIAAKRGIKVDGLDTSAIGRAIVKAIVPAATDEQLASAVYVEAVIAVADATPRHDSRFDAVRPLSTPATVDPLAGLPGSERLRRVVWGSPDTSSR